MSGYNGLVVVVDVCRGREKSESAREMQEEGEEQTRKKGIKSEIKRVRKRRNR